MNIKLRFIASLWASLPLAHLSAQTPIAYYTFDNNATDQTGNGNNGTIQGNYAFNPGGGLTLYGDNSLEYSGGGRVLLPGFSNALNNGFTFDLWVKDIAIGGNPVGEEDFISFGQLDSPETGIAINNNDSTNPELEFYVDTGLGGPLHLNFVEIYDPIPNLTAFEDTWENLALVYTPENVSAYLNGALVTSVADPALDFEGFPVLEGGLNSHWWSTGQSARMTATYDDVGIYEESLTEQQIKGIYTKGVSAGVPDVADTAMCLVLASACLWGFEKRYRFRLAK